MAFVVDNIHLVNFLQKIDTTDIVILRVTEKEVQEAFPEYKNTKFSEFKIKSDKHKGHIKRKYQKYHKDIRQYMKLYHLLKSKKDG